MPTVRIETIPVVKICGIPHKIIECDDAFNIDTHCGQINYGKAEIKINKDLSDEMKQETLCHEIVHGMLVVIGRNDLSNDETLVQCLGNAINQTFTLKMEEREVEV